MRNLLRKIKRNLPEWIVRTRYKRFDDNPFQIIPSQLNGDEFIRLAKGARQRTYPEFMAQVEDAFGYQLDKNFVDDLALSTQVVLKKSEILYVHAYLLYGALRHYLDRHPESKSVTILETGTARGFSATCMAKALDDAQRAGKILTIDVLHAEKPIYWNCIHDLYGRHTRLELLTKWHQLIEDYVIFLRGSSYLVLSQLGVARINFVFLDSIHDYPTLKKELDYVTAHQRPGDVIICDDYTPQQFPGVVQAVDELLAGSTYEARLFTTAEQRGYMYCVRIRD